MTAAKPTDDIARYGNVLVLLDGSDFAVRAVSTARALAARFQADIYTITVADAADKVADLRRNATDALGSDKDFDADHVTVVVADDAVEAIENRARELDRCLVCLTTHGRGRVAGAVIGSVARSLLQRSSHPLVALGPVAADRPELVSRWRPLSVPRLVACVDGSPTSEAVLPVAVAWATALEMSLSILTVAEPAPEPLRAGAKLHRSHGPDGDAEEYIETLVERWRGSAPEVTGLVHYDPISPADGVRSHLDRYPAGLVAVTTHAPTGVKRVLFGADAAAIVHASIAPCLVVPLPQD
jgi:nucleotide-binding universal stress UspA family protein